MTVSGNKKRGEAGRDGAIDFLRGTGVIFMIITHVNAVFYAGRMDWLDGFTWWGATVCFTIFLFCSGAATGIKLIGSLPDWRVQIKRAAILLLVYYLSAAGAVLLGGGRLDLVTVRDVLLLLKIPPFTEFILTFVLYSLLMAVAGRFLKWALRHKGLLFVGSLGVFALANFLYGLDWGGGALDIIKGLLVGNLQWHRFGMLSYFPVFVLGLIWGAIQKENKRYRWDLALGGFLLSIGFFGLLFFTKMSTYNRWPPSLIFMLYGIIYCLGVLGVWPLLPRLRVIERVGRHSLWYFALHIWIILGFMLIIGPLERNQLSVVTVQVAVSIFAVFVVELLIWKCMFSLKNKAK